jgi:DNA-binding beta-propeller fold protein YncE
VLIADRSNNRLIVVNPQGAIVWEFPRPGDLAPGGTFLVPDDAFFTPDGKQIIATEEDDFVISIIDVATHQIVYRYGTPGQPGSGPNQLWNPDDAMVLPDGDILTADIKNCRLLLIGPGANTPTKIYGQTTNACLHNPPARFGSPNGAFPMTNGHWLVTEINGDWVDEMGIDGTIYKSWHPPGLDYPSDSNEVSPGLYVTVNYSSPGVLETFDGSGNLVWRYQPLSGDPQLNHPSLALPLPNGDFLMNDDENNRVVVIDPRTDKVMWQYGVTGKAGIDVGLLNNPDGVDLVPPNSLVVTHAASIGQP